MIYILWSHIIKHLKTLKILLIYIHVVYVICIMLHWLQRMVLIQGCWFEHWISSCCPCLVESHVITSEGAVSWLLCQSEIIVDHACFWFWSQLEARKTVKHLCKIFSSEFKYQSVLLPNCCSLDSCTADAPPILHCSLMLASTLLRKAKHKSKHNSRIYGLPFRFIQHKTCTHIYSQCAHMHTAAGSLR